MQIRVGKDNGKSGKVLKVYPSNEAVLVEGLNTVKKHRRPRKQGEKGEIVTLARPLNISKVMLICPSCGKPARVGFRVEQAKGGKAKKSRYCKSCQGLI